jgi:hypothetical protein
VSHPLECNFEAEVLSAVLESRWPEAVTAELREHASKCLVCSDVVAVAGAINETGREVHANISVPDSGRVWWLAQMRARREVAESATRPITFVQLIAFAAVIGLLGACIGATSTWFQSALVSLKSAVASVDYQAALGMLASHAALAIGMGALLLLVPAAVYLAIGRD